MIKDQSSQYATSNRVQSQTYLNGPMNISYKRRESAPYSEMTSSGLTTFPLLLLILWARASIRMSGFSFRTKESPDFVTYAPGKSNISSCQGKKKVQNLNSANIENIEKVTTSL